MTDIDVAQKKEISWDNPEYLDKVQLQILSDTPSTSRAGVPYTKPCGIALCLPQRSQTPFNSTAKTGIHFEISKNGSLIGSKSQFTISEMEEREKFTATKSAEEFSTIPHCLSVLREKLDTICDKIIHYLKK